MDLNLDSDTFLTKLNIRDRSIYIKVLWKQNDTDLFHIKIFEANESWSGRFSNEFAEKYQECMDETKDEYTRNIRLFLTGNSDECVFDFTRNNPDEGTFNWRKTFKDSTATRLHGSVPLHRDDVPVSKDTLIDYLLGENKGLHDTLADLTNKTETLTRELDKCKVEMEKFVDIKSSLEADLYSKFVQLLNAKKRRIQLLEENLQQM
ncbi:uncharacterized protein [Choristoneura fumiferana]|uniref:uncharacterized protein n=1 Tax=Choristoneura fumiferana TaxID=7141 RepID=UPI003D15C6FE